MCERIWLTWSFSPMMIFNQWSIEKGGGRQRAAFSEVFSSAGGSTTSPSRVLEKGSDAEPSCCSYYCSFSPILSDLLISYHCTFLLPCCSQFRQNFYDVTFFQIIFIWWAMSTLLDLFTDSSVCIIMYIWPSTFLPNFLALSHIIGWPRSAVLCCIRGPDVYSAITWPGGSSESPQSKGTDDVRAGFRYLFLSWLM